MESRPQNFAMAVRVILPFLALIFLSLSNPSYSSKPHSLTKGSSLSVDIRDDHLISQDRTFTAGFYNVGPNAYSFAVWFTDPLSDGTLTAVWMANRDTPVVNGVHSKLSLLISGDLVLQDAGQPVWATGTEDLTGSVELKLSNTGNLFLVDSDGDIHWQSFDSPTDTLLPNQNFTKYTELVSSRSLTNHSSGFYKLFYDNDNVLRLVYNGPRVTSVYWPNPGVRAWDAGRSTYMTERTARFNSSGYFISTDLLSFYSSDYGDDHLRRLTIGLDGNVRLYSLDPTQKNWRVSWQALQQPCLIHGICGENSTCSYDRESGRKCSCLPRHTMINPTDWSEGCKPEFSPTSCGDSEVDFVYLPHIQFYGFDAEYYPNYTLDGCKQKCLSNCDCKGFQYQYDNSNGYYLCYVKFRLFSGFILENYDAFMYLKLPRISQLGNYVKNLAQETGLNCSGSPPVVLLQRKYHQKQESKSIKFMAFLAYAVGGLEIVFITIFFCYNRASSTGKSAREQEGYIQAATGSKPFSYSELRKASRNFKDEIGRGGGGVVFKGVLPDNRKVAIKRLNKASINQGEAEFLAEASTIGRVNHMNLTEIFGFCAEGKHRLLVYEYMDHGSLAENLTRAALDWDKRYEIAVGTARGLAYLHEECLDWILHCDVKPQNILLDANYKPKVADFGLSKLLDRRGINNSRFSRMRGTRGYMAPEWALNLPITSKVDVYSYGVVMLEMITGRSPMVYVGDGETETGLVSWVRVKFDGRRGTNWVEEIVDSTMRGEYDKCVVENLVKVALQCVEEDSGARPTMSEVVNMLLYPLIDN